METRGPYLRSAREAKGMDLRDAAQQTRISINFLKAIEEEDFAKLPGDVFVKGFLKSYARFLQLSEDDVMKRYAELIRPAAGASSQKSEKAKAAAAPPPQSAPETERAVKMSWEPLLWGGIAVISLAALLLIVVPGRHHRAKEPPRQPATYSTVTASVVTTPSVSAIPEKLYLDIIALDDVWVLVRTDSSPQKKAVLKKGESITWSADARFLVSCGSIGAVKLVLNGKELTVTGPKNAVVHDLIITSEGIAFQKFEAEKPKPVKPKAVTKPATTVQRQASPPPPPVTPTPEQPAAPASPAPAATSPKPSPKPEPGSPIQSILSPQQ